MPLVATSGSGCTIERPQARCTELRNAPQGPLRAPRSPRSNGLQPLRCSEAKAFLRAVAPGSAMVRTPGVSLLGLLAPSLLCAIRPCRPRAGCVFCFPLLLLWRSSQALRRTPVRSQWVGSASGPLRYWGARRRREVGPLVSLVDLSQRPLTDGAPHLAHDGFKPRRCSSSHHSSTFAV